MGKIFLLLFTIFIWYHPLQSRINDVELNDNSINKISNNNELLVDIFSDIILEKISKKNLNKKKINCIIYSILIFSLILFTCFFFILKKIKKQIKFKENRFKSLFQIMNQGVIYFDPNKTIIDINSSAEDIFGIKKNNIIGKYFDELDIHIILEDGSPIQLDNEVIKKVIITGKKINLVLGTYNKNTNQVKWLNTIIIPDIKNNKIKGIYSTFDEITDLKLALDTIEDREKETNKIIENMASGFAYHKIIYNKNGNPIDYEYIKTNKEFHKLTGIPEDVVGKKFNDLFPQLKKEWIEDYAKVAETQIPNRIERFVESMNKWFDISVYSPKEGYFATIFTDITDRKNNEQILRTSEDALRENQKRLSTTFESIGDGAIAIDTSFKVTMMNKIAKDILHCDENYFGTDLDKIFNLKDININGHSIKEIAHDVITTKKPYYINHAILYIKSTKETKIIEDSISPIYDGDIMYGLVIVFRDITEKILIKEKNEELENQLNQAQKMESVGQFAGGIAHNFNNIITAINGYVSIIESEVEDDFKFQSELDEIKNSAIRASDLTSQLLTVSRRQSTNPDIIDPNIILCNLSSMMETLAGGDIIIENKFKSKNLIKADQSQLEQIVLNFVANSKDALNLLKDNKKKQIIIGTEDYYVSQEYSDKYLGVKQGEYIIISFSDNGTGIKEDIKQKIFDPFFTTKEKGKGTGLGLSTVYGIVKQNKAAIHTYSELGKGTTFKIFWPITLDKDKQKIDKIQLCEKVIEGNEKILFVEDESSLQNLAKHFLSKLGYDITIAVDGVDGLQKLNGKASDIDIMVTDVVMPNMSGSELYKEMKKLNPNIKVLFTSGYTRDHLIGDKPVSESEEIEFISKPYSLKSLAEKIREILDN